MPFLKTIIVVSSVSILIFVSHVKLYVYICSYRAKYAIGAIKKKLNDKNPHVALYALEVRHMQAYQQNNQLILCMFLLKCPLDYDVTSLLRSWSQW